MDELQKIAIEFLNAVKKELDPYTTNKSVVKPLVNGAELLTPAHVQFAKYGRGPGKQPPVEPLIDWVKKKGIISSGNPKEIEGTAWGIAISISKRGTKNWVPNAPSAIEEAITHNEQAYMDKAGDIFAIQISGEIQEVVENSHKPHESFTI